MITVNMSSTNEKTIPLGTRRENGFIASYKVVDDTRGGNPLANTGLAYDSVNDYLIVAEYGGTVSSRILTYDKSFNLIGALDITATIDHIQGLAYNGSNRYYVWGTKKGMVVSTANGVCKGYNLAGTEVFTHDVAAGFGTPKSSMSYQENHLWFGTGTQIVRVSIATWITAETRNVISTEGIFVMPEGSVWLTRNENINCVNSADEFIYAYPMQTDETEGIVVDNDYFIWHNADKYLHGMETNGNRVYKYLLYPLLPYPEDIVVNGSFNSDTVWTKEVGWTISGGKATMAATGFDRIIYQQLLVEAGESYLIEIVVSGITAGELDIYFDSGIASPADITSDGSYKFIKADAGDNDNINIRGDPTFSGSVDKISVKKIK